MLMIFSCKKWGSSDSVTFDLKGAKWIKMGHKQKAYAPPPHTCYPNAPCPQGTMSRFLKTLSGRVDASCLPGLA